MDGCTQGMSDNTGRGQSSSNLLRLLYPQPEAANALMRPSIQAIHNNYDLQPLVTPKYPSVAIAHRMRPHCADRASMGSRMGVGTTTVTQLHITSSMPETRAAAPNLKRH